MVQSTDRNYRIVEAVGLTKVFRDFWMRTKATAVDNVDFNIDAHEVFGLLGPNGSGKSTIIKMILGLLHKSRGRLVVFGKDPGDVQVKKRIGFLPEESYLYRFLNPRETLEYYGKLFGLERSIRRRRADELLDMVGLSQVAHRPIGEFSKGMTRRIGLAQALINDPDFLILDEPTSGLDPIGTRQVKELILDLRRRGKTILLSSHLLADVEDVCDRMAVLYGGKVRAEGTADELLRDSEHTVIRTSRLTPETIAEIEQIVRSKEGKALDAVEAPRQRLEQLFLDIVDRARHERVLTSGALHGGSTARFLQGQPVEGEELIDSLLQSERTDSRAEEAEPAATDDGADDAQRETISELVGDDESVPPPRATSAEEADQPADEEVDRSVIESLTESDGEKRE